MKAIKTQSINDKTTNLLSNAHLSSQNKSSRILPYIAASEAQSLQ